LAKPTTARSGPFLGTHIRTGLNQKTLVAALMCLLLCACGSGNRNSASDVGGLRVVNAVSDSQEISFLLEGTSLGILAFGQASGFVTLSENSFDIDAGFTTLAGESVVLLENERVRVRTLEQTTLVLAGTVAAPVAFEIEEDNPLIAPDAVELQFINTAGSAALDLYLTEPGAALGAPQATVPANSASNIVAAEPGLRQVRLTTAGSNTVVFDSGTFTLPGGERLLLHARPYFGPGTATVDLTVIDTASTSNFPEAVLPATVRVANAIADLPAADVIIDNAEQTTDLMSLPRNSFSEAVEVEPGQVDINVTMETDPGTEFVTDSSLVFGGEQRTLIAAGNFGSNTTTGRLAVDPQRPISTVAQINFLHGSVSVGELDVYLLPADTQITATTPLVPGLRFLGNSNMTVPEATYTLALTRPGDTAELAESISITVDNNRLYSILLTDADGGGEPLQIIRGPNFE